MHEQQNENEAAMRFEDADYVQQLWEQFYPRLRTSISDRVRAIRRPVASDSEIALSAFHSFVQRAREGQFPKLADQDQVWLLLRTIAIRKANDHRKSLRAKKRGGEHRVYGQADMAGESDPGSGVDAAVGSQPAPSLDVEVAELFNSMRDNLPDDRHRDVLLLKLQGASITEIAKCLATSTRTVQRLLRKIEEDWRAELFDC